MEKIALRCDLCNGSLEMQPGGQTAICEFCGTKYSIGRLREKIQEIRGEVSVSGPIVITSEDFEIRAGVLIHYNGKDTNVVVPDGVLAISRGCFTNMAFISSITLPKGLQEIGVSSNPYTHSRAQDSLYASNGYIGSNTSGAFSGCSGLKKIIIPDGIRRICNFTFRGCTSLVDVTLPQGIEEIGISSFESCSNLKQIVFPDGIKLIGSKAFSFCSRLEKLTFPDSLNQIGLETFRGCKKLTEVRFPDKKLQIGRNAFRDTNLQSISPPKYREFDSETLLDTFSNTPWLKQLYKESGVCQYCGSNFSIFTKRCKNPNCGKPKDY